MVQFGKLFSACALVSLLSAAPQLTLVDFADQAQAQRANQTQGQQTGPRQFGPRVVPPGNADGQAQGQRPQRPPAVVKETHGDWAITCEASPRDGKETCVMAQRSKLEDDKPGQLTLIIAKAGPEGQQRTIMRVIAPIGVYLPLGVALEIDGAAVARVPYTQCVPQACFAIADARAETIDKLKRGAKANFIIYRGPGQGASQSISLKGFTAAKNALDAL